MSHTNGAGAIKSLGEAPLALVHLRCPVRHVVGGRVAQDVVEGFDGQNSSMGEW